MNKARRIPVPNEWREGGTRNRISQTPKHTYTHTRKHAHAYIRRSYLPFSISTEKALRLLSINVSSTVRLSSPVKGLSEMKTKWKKETSGMIIDSKRLNPALIRQRIS
jgi:hypothetical protein